MSKELIEAILKIPTIEHVLGGQKYKHVCLEEVLAVLGVKEQPEQPVKWQPVKWQPPGGPFLITAVGNVIDAPDRAGVFYDPQLIRRRRPTPQQAERSARELRTMEMLLVYRDAECPDYMFNPGYDDKGYSNATVVYNHDVEMWDVRFDISEECPASVYFEPEVAIKLVERLNNGEIDV